MNRFSLRLVALLLLATLLLFPLCACKRNKGGQESVALPPEGAVFVFSDVQNIRIEGEASDMAPAQLPDVFSRDYHVYAYENGEVLKKLDTVMCQNGNLTLLHFVGKGAGELTSVGAVYDELEQQTITLGTYGDGGIKLTRPTFESATYADGTLIFSIMETAGDLVYCYDVVFSQITR